MPRQVPLTPWGRGINQYEERTQMPPGFVWDSQNMVFSQGKVAKRGGYQIRSATGLTTEVLRQGILFDAGDGSKIEVWITDENAYAYTLGTDSLTSILTSGDIFGGSAQSGHTDDCWISWTIVPDTEDSTPRLIFTDGVEYDSESDHTLYLWDCVNQFANTDQIRVSVDEADNWFTLDQFNFAKQVIWFADHLMIGHYSVGGDIISQGIVWSNTLNTNFSAQAVDAGNQGSIVLGDATGKIIRFLKLGSHLAIYCEHSIVICDRIPTAAIFDFDVRVQGVGILGPGAVTDIGGVHIFLGEDNVYLYDGGLHPRPVGTRIIDKLLGLYDDSKANKIIAQHDRRRFKANFFVPSSSDTYATNVFSYDYIRDTWSYWKLRDGITGVGQGLTGSTALRFNDALFTTALPDGSYERFGGFYGNFRFGDYAFQDSRTIEIAGTDDSQVVDFTLTTPDERGDEIQASFETGFVSLGETYGEWGRITEIELRYKGSGFNLAFALEDGKSWTGIESVPDHTSFSVYRIPVDIVGEFIGFRITTGAQSSALELTVLSVTVEPWGSRSLDGN